MSTSLPPAVLTPARFQRRWHSCAYCGKPRATKDHVPPKGLFGDLFRHNHGINLITVPSCASCNNPESKDDTYFRDALAFIHGSEYVPLPDGVKSAIDRSVKHAGRNWLSPVHSFAKSARKVWYKLPDSGLLERRVAIAVKWARIKKTAERIVRGLYWHHKSERVPEDYEVSIFGEAERNKFDQGQHDEFDELARAALGGERRIVQQDVFMYSFAACRDDPRSVVVLMVFYRRLIFLALVSEKDAAPAVAAAP